MNTERITLLADHLEQLPETRFAMNTFMGELDDDGVIDRRGPANQLLHECGTLGCIAGWTCALFSPNTPDHDIRIQAQALLDLTNDEADILFFARGHSDGLHAPKGAAVATLRRAAETGVIQWNS